VKYEDLSYCLKKGYALPDGILNNLDEGGNQLLIPCSPLKRYWNQELWNQITIFLLNPLIFSQRKEFNTEKDDPFLEILNSLEHFLEKEKYKGKVRNSILFEIFC
jgi:hypothetical protein